MRRLLKSMALAAVIAQPAMAADLPIGPGGAPPPVMPVWSWTSWYVGVYVGAAWAKDASTSDPCRTTPSACWLAGGEVVHYSLSPSFLGGLTAGYNYQIPGSSILFGFETEVGALSLKGSADFSGVSNVAGAGSLTANATIAPWYNATTLRVGWAWDRALFYGKGGIAIATIESTIQSAAIGNGFGPLGPGTGKRDLLGWAWGGGFEYAFAPQWSVKAEYLWLGLNHGVSVCAGAPAGGQFCGNTSTGAVQTVKVGVNYLLNAGPVYARY